MGRKKAANEANRRREPPAGDVLQRRRSGLLIKARDLSVLCDVQVAAVVLSGHGKLYDFSSGTNCSVATILQRYQSHCETGGRVAPVVCERETQLMMENILTLHEKERKLRDENELLKQEIAEVEEDDKRITLPITVPKLQHLACFLACKGC
ncbi:hypothetical protein RJ639_034398 [Escallonia herrerae]|uniref:MADS-box domain-containing protein n=1 Tax=Escallonia herrerae TaxID=1293975 RepID=A0AA88WSK2_9ASTE|nr:hypothetical protein RJ639_034398 [Escallonia herrerae]